jgi:hypothetical protein
VVLKLGISSFGAFRKMLNGEKRNMTNHSILYNTIVTKHSENISKIPKVQGEHAPVYHSAIQYHD